ncbi:MAG: methionyl-tRNA formyltransferase, partial [Alphaproteobacteria bacterium]
MNRPLRIVFCGTPDFAVPALDALIAAGHEIVAVLTQPPRPGGRGRQPRPGPVQRFAEAHDLPVLTPSRLKDNREALDRLRALAPDLGVVAAYGLILPEEMLAIPAHG